MSKMLRFGISLEKELLDRFDNYIKEQAYQNRSEAVRDLIREELVKEEWERKKEVSGAVTLVYDHHKRELVNQLMNIQHDFHEHIISTQHIHLDHNNCLEVVVVKGKAEEVEKLYRRLKSIKGIKHIALAKATTGKTMV